mmetsp:Transcript_322/g.641  ORF Transcript_322/g.641 Transcript_322/m.641 type:complete len:379 (-) Transcript_322:66-1202(-)
MSSLFGVGGDAAKKSGGVQGTSLTESIFGSSASAAPAKNDLFAKQRILSTAERHQRQPKRQRTNVATTRSGSTEKEEKTESRDETLQRRRRQSQHKSLDQLTISLKDYDGRGDDMEELCGDVRGLMKHHGLVILRDALSEKDVSRITKLADATQRRICETLDAKQIPYNSLINNTKTFCFRELAVRCQGRMDVRYEDGRDDDDTESNKSNNQKKKKKKLPSLPVIDNLAASILHGAEAPNLVYAGWIFSFPESADQPWHQDGSPLFEKGTESLPSYALNVFCGLHDAKQLLELGPTEFVVGSHHMEPDGAMNGIGDPVSAVLGKGDILLYDYRICHRGTSNLSSSVGDTSTIRKVLYLMYARPWFREHLNFGNKSLFK